MASLSQSWRPGVVWPDVSLKLHQFYCELRRHFGYEPRWWPGSPWEITLSALLVQQCDWTVAHQGVQRLIKKGYRSISELADAEPAIVHDSIRSISFAPTKSQRLVGFSQRLRQRGFDDMAAYLASDTTDILRTQLLELPGIGHETADAILLFAGESHPTFVVDAYSRRILSRARLSARLDERFWNQPAPLLRQFLLDHLLADITNSDQFDWDTHVPREVAVLRDYHAQLVELGRHHCLKSNPRCHTSGKQGWTDYKFCQHHCNTETCQRCPLIEVCRHGRNQRREVG